MAVNQSLGVSQQMPSSFPCQFSCRIVTIDYYTASPVQNLDVCYSEFRSSAVDRVPVIRIFGSTPTGQKTCLHIHGAFPYLYVPCVIGAPTDSYLQQLTRSIDHALQVSLGASSKPACHVFKIVIVKGIPFYGYHDTEELFLKIYLYNPALIKRLSDLLVAGAIMNQVLQPHESHVPFVLQFMIDYNLYGMNYIHLAAVKFRLGCNEKGVSPRSSQSRSSRLTSPLSPLSPPTHSSLVCNPSQTHWNVNTLPRDMVVCISKESVCELETDALAADIVNRHELSMVSGGYPGLAAIWAEERQRRTMLNIELPLTPPMSPDRCSQPYHRAEERLRVEFDRIIEERLGVSANECPSVDSLVYSQSCDLDLNQPTSVEDYEDSASVAKQPTDQSVIVNEDIVQESMELSQRLSAETIKKSTDAELLELMMDLCQTQPTDSTQLSQSLSASVQHSQREGDNTETTKLMKSHSIFSEKSLFGSPPPNPGGGNETAAATEGGVLDISISSMSDEDLFSSQPAGLDHDHVTDSIAEGGTVLSHLNTHSPNTAAQNGHRAPTLVYNEEHSSCHERHQTEHDDEQEQSLLVSIRLPIAAHYGNRDKKVPEGFTSDKDREGENRAQFEADFELPSRLTSPIPPSPDSKELQQLDFKELDSFNSSGVGREIDNMEISESQLSIPCAQPHHSPSPVIDPQAEADLHQVWNLTPSLSKDSPLKLRPEPATNSQPTVQLEYEMPEISMTEFDVSDDPIITALESDTASPLVNETEDLKTLTSSNLPPPSQLLRHCSSGSSRRELLRALSSATGDVDSDGVGDGRVVEGDGGSVESEESEQDDGVWMSQEVWDEDESILSHHKMIEELADDKEIKKQRDFDPIPQLDGSGDVPSPRGGIKKRKKKTLGMRRGKKSHSLATLQTSVTSSRTCSDVNEPKATSSDGSDSCKEPSGMDSSSKSRRSLSLKRPTKKLHRTKEQSLKSYEQLKSQSDSQSSSNPNNLEEADALKEQALNCRFKIHLAKLPSSCLSLSTAAGVSKMTSEAVKKKPAQVVSKRKERYEARLRRKRTKSNSGLNPVEEEWSNQLKDLSYVQQLRMALEESKKTASLMKDTPTEQPTDSTLVTTTHDKDQDDIQATSMETTSSSTISTLTDEMKQPTLDTSVNSRGPISPQLLSPVTPSTPGDLDNITVVDESPLNSGTENEMAMDIQLSQDTDTESQSQNPSQSDVNDLKLVSQSAITEEFFQDGSQPELMKTTAVSVLEDKQPELSDDVWSLDGPLDTSISSICESPPFTSSPKDQERQQLLDTHSEEVEGELLHDSDLKLYLDGSFDTEFDVAMETDSATVQTDDSVDEATEHEFHLALSSEDDNWNTSLLSSGGGDEGGGGSVVATKTTDQVTLSVSAGVAESRSSGVLQDVQRESSVMKVMKPLISPPSSQDLMASASSYDICSAQYIKAFYSNPTDVQPPMEVGGRILRVPSRMPYELKEFEPVYVKSGRDCNSQFSTTGLQQMRLIVSMLSSSIPGTQPTLPPLCHPPSESTRNNMVPYTAEDHKRDVELKSTFYSSSHAVVLTPVKPPPHPTKLTEQLLKIKKCDKPVEGKMSAEKNEEIKKDKFDGTAVGGGKLQPPVTATDGDNSTITQCDESAHFELNCTSISLEKSVRGSLGEKFSHDPPREESGTKSPHSIQSNSSSCVLDDSLTSYQVPKQTHSTPVRGDGCEAGDSGEGGEDGDSEIKLSNGSSRERSCTPVRSKNDITRPQFPFTPINSQSRKSTSQLEGPTPNNAYGFKISQSVLPVNCDIHEVQYLTSMSVELHVRTRGTLRPDPEFDPVLALFYFIHNDWPSEDGGDNTRLGVVAIDIVNCGFGSSTGRTSLPVAATATGGGHNGDGVGVGGGGEGYLAGSGIAEGVEVMYVSSEAELFERLVQLVRDTDPDFLIGYEVTMLSWGYLIERAAALNINLINELSRMPKLKDEIKTSESVSRNESAGRWSSDSVHVLGRIVLNLWRLLRHEVALTSYSFESTSYHVLHQRVPLYSFESLTSWYDHPTSLYRYRVVEHYLRRCHGNFDLIEKFNLIGRTSEFARLYGIEFENVTARGSQYRVESMMLRLAKPANYIAISPSVQQRARMAAPECLQLILEPESKFYTDPVVVLDFQSLYPSIVIGYNYCFSTCLGRVRNLAQNGDFTFGTNTLNVPNHTLKKIKDHVHISPNGVVFVKHHIRKGVMTTMLEEILGTRIMVKGSMKQHKANKALQRMLNARQLGLKLISNVTYGYTAANYSGRMPCVEIADSIVRKGRETLERAIQLVNSNAEWRARVVYGDTDSLFVLLKGASKEEAFQIGKEIVDRVTAENPKPVKLKFEKVYLPCILQTKKRYVGYMYETLDQAEPVFDAKGIETVRRDGCPAVGKILEKSLHLLFTTKDLSLIKTYFQRQCSKLLDGKVNIQDYTFAKEYRGRSYYRPGACVPALELAKSNLAVDRRSEPRVGERVPYVIVYGTPGQPLIQLVRRPGELLENPGLRLNGVYYITKQILPALNRCFSLMGVDMRQWYTEMPRVIRAPVQVTADSSSKKPKGTLGQYFATIHCPVCEELTTEGLCVTCSKNPRKVALSLNMRIQDTEKASCDIEELCQDCVGSRDPTHHSKCLSLDCPVLYRKHRAKQELASAESLRKLLDNFLSTAVTNR